MTSTVINIDTDDIVKSTINILEKIPTAVWREARRKGALRVKGLFYKYLPVGRSDRQNRGRRLRSKIHMRFTKNQAEIYPGKKVTSEFGGSYYLGAILEAGSPGGMIIYPRRAKYLRFRWRGKNWAMRSVRRGAIPPQGFMEKVMADAREEIPKIYTEELLKHIHGERLR